MASKTAGVIDWSRNLDLVRVLALDDDGTYMPDSGDARLPEVWSWPSAYGCARPANSDRGSSDARASVP